MTCKISSVLISATGSATTHSEVVGSGRAKFQIGGEESRRKRALDGVEKGLCRLGSHRVDAAEGKPNETVILRVRHELRRHGRRGLHRLRGGSNWACVA